jgi:hypothetical protein
MTRRTSEGAIQAACRLWGAKPDGAVQVSSPQHQVNPAASSHYVRRKVREPSSSYRAKAMHSAKNLEAALGPSGVMGNGTFTQRATELGRSSSAGSRLYSASA